MNNFLAMILWLKFSCLFEEIVRYQGKKLNASAKSYMAGGFSVNALKSNYSIV
jgi:hypothetical protein